MSNLALTMKSHLIRVEHSITFCMKLTEERALGRVTELGFVNRDKHDSFKVYENYPLLQTDATVLHILAWSWTLKVVRRINGSVARAHVCVCVCVCVYVCVCVCVWV